ncbi:MAG: 4-phosphoerythronate dehydrogenase [Phycisphaerae bacterium]
MKIIADQNIPFVKECFSSIGDVTAVSGREITAEILRDADILLVRSITPVNEQLLSGSKVKFVATATIGFEHVDIDYLNAHNIGFTSAPGSNANSVAEYIIAALLEIGKNHNIELAGKSIGIIGVGNVGSRVENKCKAIGMNVVLNDPPLRRQTNDDKYRPIEELYNCDFITFHTPLTYEGQDKTHHLADEDFFSNLKNGVIFLNTSRGGVVDTGSLKNALKTGKIKAAVLDVWEDEPAIDTDLLEMVDIGTPHIAGYSYDGKVAGMIMIYNEACAYFNIEAKHRIGDFLPKPAVPEVKIQIKGFSDQRILRAAVNEIYKIKDDDRRMRGILNLPLGKRCAAFDKLRKEYPVRREFQNTNIILAAENTEKVMKKLNGIGFQVNI